MAVASTKGKGEDLVKRYQQGQPLFVDEGGEISEEPSTPGEKPLTRQELASYMDERLRDKVGELLNDEEILDCRRELSILRNELFGMATVGYTEDYGPRGSYVNALARLATSISSIAKSIHEMERGKQHYLHINVTATMIGAFADLARNYIPDSDRLAAFEHDMTSVIRSAISESRF